jgi:hypothetical protein
LANVAREFLRQLPTDRELVRAALAELTPRFELLKAIHDRGPADESNEAILTHLAVSYALISMAVEQKEEVVLAAKRVARGDGPSTPVA